MFFIYKNHSICCWPRFVNLIRLAFSFRTALSKPFIPILCVAATFITTDCTTQVKGFNKANKLCKWTL